MLDLSQLPGESGGRQRAPAGGAARGGHGALRVCRHAREHRQRQGAGRLPRGASQGTASYSSPECTIGVLMTAVMS